MFHSKVGRIVHLKSLLCIQLCDLYLTYIEQMFVINLLCVYSKTHNVFTSVYMFKQLIYLILIDLFRLLSIKII